MSVVVVELPAVQDQQVAEKELLVQGLTRLDIRIFGGFGRQRGLPRLTCKTPVVEILRAQQETECLLQRRKLGMTGP